MAAAAALIAQLDGAVREESPERCAEVLHQVTTLFLSTPGRLDDPRLDLFDGVLMRLIDRVPTEALVALSERLCRIEAAPVQSLRRLSAHPTVEVAGPVLTHSRCLSESDLMAVAQSAGPAHVLAIAARSALQEALTDAMIRRDDPELRNALARNAGACFSEAGYAILVGKAARDESLTEWLGLRLDIPTRLFRELLEMASDVVRARFLTATRPIATKEARAESANPAPLSPEVAAQYRRACEEMTPINRAGRLNNQTVNRFAVRGEYTRVVAAISLLATVDLETVVPLIQSDRLYGLIVACKASRLNWDTTRMVIRHRPNCPLPTPGELERGREVFEALPLSAAQWTIRFGHDRIVAKQREFAAKASI